jgi:hypothetical protein
MKSTFTITFLFISCFLFAQKGVLEESISIYFFENSLPEIFEKIEEYSTAEFAYSIDYIPDTTFTINFTNKKISTILNRLFQKTKLVYKAQDNRVIISYDENKYENQRQSENKYTLSGYLTDTETGEELIGGTIRIMPLYQGCFTNSYGFFSITLPEGVYEIEASYVGYERAVFELNLQANQRLKLEIKPYENSLTEVVILGEKQDEGILIGENGSGHIELTDLNNLPGLLGEKDIFGSLQLLPGIQANGEGNGGFSIRGGSSDQNLILLDEAPIYNPAHLAGIFSIFNGDAIKNVRVMKSNLPTEFRGRLSSVIDIQMKEGNSKEFDFSGGIGLLMTRLKLEGPFAKNKGSFMLAGRRTYHDLWIRPLTNNDFRLYFYDINAKANYKLNEKNRLFFSIYLGDDVFRIEEDFRIVWGNQTGTFRWNHLYNDKLFSNTTFIFSDFDFDSSTDLAALVNIENASADFLLRTRVRDYHLKQTFNYYPTPNHSFKFGLNLIHHTFIPGKLLDEDLEPTVGETSNRFAVESSVFATHNMKINEKWNIDYGLHFSNFTVLGGNDYLYKYNETGARIDSTYYQNWELIKNYFGIEPRIAIRNQFTPKTQWHLSYFHTIQYQQLLPSAFINNPASTWFPSSHIIKPQRSNQLSWGLIHEFNNKKWEATLDLYGKMLHHQIAYRDGATLELGSDIESQLVFGKAWAYGVELLIKKRIGKFRGWLSTTLSKAKNQNANINGGKAFNSELDRPLNVSLVGIYETEKNLTISTTWSYITGKLVTVPAGKYQIDGQIIDYYNNRNNFRMSDFHRLDLSFRWKSKTKRGGNKYWSLAFYNLYARKNASFVYVEESDIIELDPENKAFEYSILPFVIPSFSFYFEL